MKILRTLVEGQKSLLLRRNEKDALELVLGNVVLLSSAALETELAFGRLAAKSSADVKRVLVGGLGFGATLRGVLEVAPANAEIIVVEKLKTVIDVARAEAQALVGDALDDPRVTVEQADVADVIDRASPKSLSAILLDVDNGPEWASFRTNAALYSEGALIKTRAKIADGGLFAVWSGYPADAFVRVLRKAGFVPSIEPLHERGVVRARAYLGMAVSSPK